MKSKKSATLEVVAVCCRALDDKKAGELTVLDVSEQSSITDYLILATATSEPHLRALRIEVEKVLDARQIHLVGIEKAQASGWMIVDAFDVMVHIFLAPAREKYGLERLWRDATEVSVARLLGTEPKPTGKVVKRKAPVRRAVKATRKPKKS